MNSVSGRSIVMGILSVVVVMLVIKLQATADPQTETLQAELPPAAKTKVDFVEHIQPIFARSCYSCHGPDEAESALRLDIKSNALKGGARGKSIIPGKSEKSELILFVAGVHKDGLMPPEGEGKPLTAKQIGLLRAWIDQGANWPESAAHANSRQHKAREHWAFQKPVRSKLPAVKNQKWVRNAIDVFVLNKLEQQNIEPSPTADRYTLIRRLSLDLVGLPPTPVEVLEFINDKRPDAYKRLVDRLLDSPHFGERWGRHWLDLARYADSDGYEADRFRPTAWRYREWVINAINNDLPFDQFTIEQLAGDLLPNPKPDQLIATGFHRQTLVNQEGGVDQEEFRNKAVVDRVSTTGTVWLGLTLFCAECHSHKYDPISQTEFYQLFAFFNNADAADYNFPTKGPQNEKFQQELQTHQTAITKIEKQIAQARQEGADPAGRLNKLINSLMRLARKAPKSPAGWAMVFHERKVPRPTHVHIRGDFLNLGAKVSPEVPAIMQSLAMKNKLPTRLDLARWVVDPANPLTARVTVNRIWLHLFGRGIVTSVDNFGIMGENPTHPQLLDWLATEFIRLGWSRKAIIGLIVNSSTYRQSSHIRPRLQQRDPANQLLARQSRFRVEAEIVRDLYLTASGLLHPVVGGPSVRPLLPPSVAEVSYASSIKWRADAAPLKYRRGMYIVFQRTIPYPSLMAFDCPEGVVTAPRRDRSNTPLQSLTLLNDPVFFECTQAMGRRILDEGPDNDFDRIRFAGQLTLSREFNDDEVQRLYRLLTEERERFSNTPEAAKKYVGNFAAKIDQGKPPIQTAAWISLCSVIMNLDEFLTRE